VEVKSSERSERHVILRRELQQRLVRTFSPSLPYDKGSRRVGAFELLETVA
jgi:hypothetical protein